jgi:hypothetical protein
MEQIDLTDRQTERVESIRAELSDAAGAYATVTTADVMAYLLDLAEGVDDPDPQEDSWPASEREEDRQFPREALREQLTNRNRKHGDEGDHEEMDLYAIAAAYDVTGRSSMTKAELVDAILDTAERRYRDPFAPVDIEFPADGGADSNGEADGDDGAADVDENDAEDSEDEMEKAETDDEMEKAETDDEMEKADDDGDVEAAEADEPAAKGESDGDAETDEETTDSEDGDDDGDRATGDAADNAQLNAMLSLLETHDDKWRETDGDARYEVELPDGSVQSVRTKDDVRAVLFKNY